MLAVRGMYELREAEEQMAWVRARWQTLHLVNIQLDKKHKIKKATDLIMFDWEKTAHIANKVPVMTREEFEETVKKWSK